ncbi:MAG: serine/threonine-protein kinase PknK, partial [bacterium]|nr:serine/threonine-protein kinase PknK [bacterium]
DSEKEQRRIRFCFVHDRVQQAAYSLIAEEERKAVHLRLGRLLRAAGDESERISDIVQQLNMGRELIVDEQEAISLIEMNLQLSRKAKNSHASREALQHVNICFELLPDNYWKEYPDLGCSLLREKIECEYIEGIHQSIARDFQLLLEKLVAKEEKANLYNLMVGMYLSQTKFRDALTISRDALALYHIEIPENKEDYQPWFQKELQTVKGLIGD